MLVGTHNGRKFSTCSLKKKANSGPRSMGKQGLRGCFFFGKARENLVAIECALKIPGALRSPCQKSKKEAPGAAARGSFRAWQQLRMPSPQPKLTFYPAPAGGGLESFGPTKRAPLVPLHRVGHRHGGCSDPGPRVTPPPRPPPTAPPNESTDQNHTT